MGAKKQAKRKSAGDTDRHQLHISIGSSPGKGFDLNKDVQMVKAALLYANKATLYSVNSAVGLHTVLDQPHYPIDLKIHHLLLFFKETHSPHRFAKRLAEVARYRQIINSTDPRSAADVEYLLKFEGAVQQSWADYLTDSEQHFVANGGDQLLRALNSGIVQVQRFGDMGHMEPTEAFIESLRQALADKLTYPLFDAETSERVRTEIEQGKIKIRNGFIQRGKQVTLAASLFERLPLFEEATIDEIIDIRKELDSPLRKFRKAIIEFSENIENAAWDDDFSSDAEQVFRRDVEPAIEEIEQGIRNNRYLRELAYNLPKAPIVVTAGSVLSAVVAQLSAWPELATYGVGAGLISGATAVAQTVLETRKAWREEQNKIEQNNLFFYYRTKELLKKKAQ